MMSPHYIPLGKVKEAFALNEHDVTPLIDALWPHEVYPFHLWANAYALFWRDAAHNNTIFYAAKSVPECPQLNNEDYPTLIPSIYWHSLSPFYHALARHLFCEDFAKGLNYIADLTYATIPPSLTDNFDYLFSGLQRTEAELNQEIHKPFTWHTNITAERFKEVLEEKAMFVPSCNDSFILNLFLDSVVVNKNATFQFLAKSGYSLKHEVKGISHYIVDTVCASLPTPALLAPNAQPQSGKADSSDKPFYAPVVVRRAFWHGLANEIVVKNLRAEGSPDEVIAYVLFTWCNLKNKTQIGKMLIPEKRHDSTYLHAVDRLLKKAAELRIITDE